MEQPQLTIFDPESQTGAFTHTDGASNRVLVVDDEVILAESLREILVRNGYEVRIAINAFDAIKMLRDEPFALVMSDHRMPQMTGLEFLAESKTIQPDASRILITGVVNLKTVIDAINQGEIFRFIVKPWTVEDLLASVNNAVQRHELIRRNRELYEATLTMNEQLASLNRSLQNKIQAEARHHLELAELNLALATNLQTSVEISRKTMQTFYPSLGAQAEKAHLICQTMGEILQLAADERQILEISALLHDIGFVGTPRRLIRLWQKNPDNLKKAELELIHQHPILGQELVSFIHHLKCVGTVIRSHHEAYNGKGFPDGLAGEEIPWLGRLLAVAVYFASDPNDEAHKTEFITKECGNAFDPEAVEVFLQSRKKCAIARREREIPLLQLRPGMILSQPIYGVNGLMLIPEGQTLTENFIRKLASHNKLQQIKQRIFVYC